METSVPKTIKKIATALTGFAMTYGFGPRNDVMDIPRKDCHSPDGLRNDV